MLVSRPIQTTYNQYGALDSFVIQWKPSHHLFPQDYIKIAFDQPIHDSIETDPFLING